MVHILLMETGDKLSWTWWFMTLNRLQSKLHPACSQTDLSPSCRFEEKVRIGVPGGLLIEIASNRVPLFECGQAKREAGPRGAQNARECSSRRVVPIYAAAWSYQR